MKKIQIKTNQGKVFDYCLNKWINFKLWLYGIYDNEEVALNVAADTVRKACKFLDIKIE